MANPTTRPDLDLSRFMPLHGTVSTDVPEKWEDALAAGNGIMGALLFGNPSSDTIIANHCKLWLPKGSREIVPSMGGRLQEMRQIIGEHGYEAGQEYFCKTARESGWDGNLLWTDPYHPGFFLKIEQPFAGEISEFVRIEDFLSGEVWSQWNTDAGAFSRRLFVSKTDNVIVSTTTGPPEAVSLSIEMLPVDNDLIKSYVQHTADGITSHNVYVKGKGGYDCFVRVVSNSGVKTTDGKRINIVDADSVTIVARILPWVTPLPESQAWSTSFENPRFDLTEPSFDANTVQIAGRDHGQAWIRSLARAVTDLPTDYQTLFAGHTEVWRAIFGRVSVDLCGEADERAMSSERLLDLAQKEHRLPLALLERMYDAGRYVYMCCAGPTTPPNLYGIWSGTWRPEWSGDYTTDTNLQLDIECAYSGNMAELMDGYFNLWDSFIPDFQRNARELFGCRGILVGSRASNNGLALHWDSGWPGNMWTVGAAWMAHWHYDHFLYTGDRKFLEQRALPFMEQAALFWEDFLAGTEDENGFYTFRPSYSAENDWGDNASQDIEVVTELLENLIAACETLGIKSLEAAKWKDMLSKMPKLLVNDEGQLQEFVVPGRQDYNDHRHMMHLYWAFDAPRFSLEHDPALYAGAQKALLNRIRYTTTQTSATHGRMHIALSAVQLGLPNIAWTRLEMMACDRSMYSNLVTSHEPGPEIFCDDGNGSIPEVVNRMVFQSALGKIFVLPSVPDAMPKGTLKGARARGQIEVNQITWDMKRGTVSVDLTSEIDQTIDLIFPLDAVIDSLTLDDLSQTAVPTGIRKFGFNVPLSAARLAKIEARFHFA